MKPFLLTMILTASCFANDKLILKTGETLHGNIKSISQEKEIQFEHIASSNDLSVDAQHATKIELNTKGKNIGKRPSSSVILSNGDALGGTVQKLSKEQLTFQSDVAGSLTIPRSNLHYITFGESVHFPIYKLKNKPEIFTKSKGWQLNGATLRTDRKAEMWQSFDLSKNFILKFSMEWENTPQLTLHLAAKEGNSNKHTNPRYLVRLFENILKFEQICPSASGEGVRSFPKHESNQSLSTYVQDQVDVELWVSRVTGNLTLFFDGKKVYNAYYAITPTGDMIGMENHSDQSQLILSNIEISSWDGLRAPKHLVVKSSSSDKDTISLKNGDTLTGSIENTRSHKKNTYYNINHKHFTSGKSAQVESNIHMIQFARKEEKGQSTSDYAVSKLSGNDKLSLSNILLKGDIITAEHPILGTLKINKEHFSSIELN